MTSSVVVGVGVMSAVAVVVTAAVAVTEGVASGVAVDVASATVGAGCCERPAPAIAVGCVVGVGVGVGATVGTGVASALGVLLGSGTIGASSASFCGRKEPESATPWETAEATMRSPPTVAISLERGRPLMIAATTKQSIAAAAVSHKTRRSLRAATSVPIGVAVSSGTDRGGDTA